MSYLPRVSMQEPLKNSQKVNSKKSDNLELQIPNSSYLKSFKKTIGNNNSINSINSIKHKTQSTNRSYGGDENARPYKPRQKSPIMEKNRNQFQQFQYVMQEADNSMEQLLNSSINQFQKLIIHEESGQSLEQQNYRLKNALSKMKNILKDKLENALQKQKEQLSKMLEDYISLITKLLQDKQELTIKIQDLADENQKKIKQMQRQYMTQLKSVADERDEQIGSTKNQIDEFLGIIEQYEDEAKQEQAKFQQMQQRIEELEEQRQHLIQQLSNNDCQQSSMQQNQEQQYSLRIQAQSTKIQTLLELLEKTQHENNGLKSEINQLRTKQSSINNTFDLKEIKEVYERKIQQIEREHEQEFLEYEKAIRDTLVKKDECIQRLNLIIEGLRERRGMH